jgi:hypothetical protein
MAVPTGTVTLADIQQEFGGTEPISLSEYYRGGAYVPDGAGTALIPTSGPISLSNFRGASKTVTITYALIGGGGGGGAGRDDDGGAGYGLYATSGGASSISADEMQTITAPGGSGGYSFAFLWNQTSLGAGEASFYGPGGALVANNTAGNDAPSTSYGAGGGGGGGDGPQTFDSSGNRGQGGFASTRVTGTVEVDYGTELTITIGGQGLGHVAGYRGANGAAGYCQITWNGNTSTFTSSGTVTIN